MLKIRALGQFHISLDGQSVEIQTDSARSILAYLLLNAGTTQRRAKLAGIFWPESRESNARNNLRHTLWRIQKAIGHDYLLTDNVSVTFDPTSAYWLDAQVLESALDEEASVDDLMAACAVYGGELLPGIYDDWVTLERERLRAVFDRQSKRLLDRLVEQRRWKEVLDWGERWVALGQAPETAYRSLMLAHAELGNQSGVAAVYRRCVDILRDDLDVEPSPETQTLYERLSSGERVSHVDDGVDRQERVTHVGQPEALSPHGQAPPTLPAFLDDAIEPPELQQSPFVERGRELSRLQAFLDETLAGRGQVVFVTGGPGRGKTSLLDEFARRAHTAHAELLVTSGHCSAYAGFGDLYLPFRDVMNMLTGSLEAKWLAGAITRQHALRLWHVLPDTIQAIMDAGPDLIDTFVPARALVDRAKAAGAAGSDWPARVLELTAQTQSRSVDLEQSYLFEQYVSVLERLAVRRPLLITLDDLQWADTASISLLFHLGRRIRNSRILIVGAYRPAEIAAGRDGDRHPLQKVLREFRRTFGDNQVDLAQGGEGEGQRFVDALLDTQPNRLHAEFRQALLRQTGGHPLFTVELLRAMQARGDLRQDEGKRWVEGPALDWDILPARVEAVIEERIEPLDARLRGILAVASAEGEIFTAEVVARVQGLGQLQLLRHLSQELGKRHRLVRELGEVRVGSRILSRYQFSHVLFQRYLYDGMHSGERRRLHLEIAEALETLYAGHTDEIAAQLLHHYLEAVVRDKAMAYAQLAARRAQAVYAYDEAIQHLQTALDLVEDREQAGTQLALLENLGDLYHLLDKRAQAVSLYQAALEQSSGLDSADETMSVRLHRKLYWTGIELKWRDRRGYEALSQVLDASRAVLEASLSRSEAELPPSERVHILTVLATDAAVELHVPLDLDAAESYAQAAVELAEQLDAPAALSDALQALNSVYYARGMLDKQRETSRRRLALSHEAHFGDAAKRSDVLPEVCRDLMLGGNYVQAIPCLQEAESLARSVGAIGPQVWALISQTQCLFRLDRWNEVLELLEKCRKLEQRYTPEQLGMTCPIISYSAAVSALRGDSDQAKDLREEAYTIMVVGGGGSPDNWGRGHHY